jgi:hypothetical protein
MWQCPSCAERHEDQFDTCWKCGASRSGEHNPDFVVAEPVPDDDPLPESLPNGEQPPILRLPTFAYFTLAAYIWIYLALLIEKPWPPAPPDPGISPIEIVVGVVATLLVGIPVSVTFFRGLFLRIIRRQTKGDYFADVRWILAMFWPPASFRCSYRWFVPIYCLSLVAWVTVPPVIIAWKVIHTPAC